LEALVAATFGSVQSLPIVACAKGQVLMGTSDRQRAGWRGFGVAGALPLEIIRVLAPAAEAAGYHTFWVNDTPQGDGLAALQTAAEVTSKIRLGVGVIPLDRQPADVIARRVDELQLPQERLILGIGSGNPKGGLARTWEGAQALEAAVEALVVVGALGPNMCALAGGGSDGVLLNWLTASYVAPSAARVDEAAREAGRPRPLILGYVRVALGPGARDVFLEEAGRYGSYPAYAANFVRMGTPAAETAVLGDTPAAIQAGLAPYTTELDETVVRAITAEESAAAYLELLEAAAPGR
jgi:alkanesulfonate monooxygenase SsuD/methylene tetrahydromethanopterin reductase-like flavin-dependent oxidoreductase (luciferase family)